MTDLLENSGGENEKIQSMRWKVEDVASPEETPQTPQPIDPLTTVVKTPEKSSSTKPRKKPWVTGTSKTSTVSKPPVKAE